MAHIWKTVDFEAEGLQLVGVFFSWLSAMGAPISQIEWKPVGQT